MTNFLQVKDNSFTRALLETLNNTSSPLVLNGLNTQKLPVVTTGFALTIWDDSQYEEPGQDPLMEKVLVTAATIATNGSITITRPNPIAHTGEPVMSLLALAQHITELQTATNTLETKQHYAQPFGVSTSVNVTHNLGKYPSVTVVDSAGDEVVVAVNNISNNLLTLSFAAAFSGVVYCN